MKSKRNNSSKKFKFSGVKDSTDFDCIGKRVETFLKIYFIVCSTEERKSYQFKAKQVNDDIIVFIYCVNYSSKGTVPTTV